MAKYDFCFAFALPRKKILSQGVDLSYRGIKIDTLGKFFIFDDLKATASKFNTSKWFFMILETNTIP